MVEWITVFHYYFAPYLHSLGVDEDVLQMLLKLLDGIAVSAQDGGCRLPDVDFIEQAFADFCRTWEELYVGADEKLLRRASMSFHLLLHISGLLTQVGSLRATSQAACERTIGTIKRELRSQRDPYVAVVNRVYELEQVHALGFILGESRDLHIPDDLDDDDSDNHSAGSHGAQSVDAGGDIDIGTALSLKATKRALPSWCSWDELKDLLKSHGLTPGLDVNFHPYVRVRRPDQIFRARTICGETAKSRRRSSRVSWLADPLGVDVQFFELMVIVHRVDDDKLLAIARRFNAGDEDGCATDHWVGGQWGTKLELIDVSGICDNVGLFATPDRDYLFPRKNAMGGYSAWWVELVARRSGRRDSSSGSGVGDGDS